MNRSLLISGMLLVLLALLTGFAVPSVALPRLGLSAHTIGLLGGTLLIAVGAIGSQLRLGRRGERALAACWIYAVYSNWLGCLVGAATGAGRATPIASAGAAGPPAAEILVMFLLGTGSLVALAAVALSLWGLRRPATT